MKSMRWDERIAIAICIVVIILTLAACQTYREYYPPTADTQTQIDGRVYGAVKLERDGIPEWSDNKQISPTVSAM